MADRDRDSHRDALDDLVAELDATLTELREELGPGGAGDLPTVRPPRPLRSVRPPSPRRVLRLTDEYAIPAAIAVLEANVRVLELFQAAIRAGEANQAAGEATRTAGERAREAGRESLDRLDRALAELSEAVSRGGLPRDREARELVTRARGLNEEIRARLEEREVDGPSEGVRIDVESELASIKESVEAEDESVSDPGGDGE